MRRRVLSSLVPPRAALPALAAIVLLAGCDRGPPVTGGAPPSIRRLTQEQYRQTIADIFGEDVKIVARFEPDNRRDGLLAVGTTWVSVTPAGFEQYDAMARGIAAQVVDEQHRARLPCAPRDPHAADDTCTRQVLETYGRQLFRRPLAPQEIDLRVELAAEAAATLGDYYSGLAFSLASLLASPDFLFRVETAREPPANGRVAQMDGYSKASRLSYFLWNTTPDEELLAAAERGELDTAEGLARQVDRLLASPRLADSTRAFFADLLHFDGFDELSKDTQIYPIFSGKLLADAREQSLRVITDHLLAAQGDYRDLFTTRQSFMTRSLGVLYEVPVASRDDWEKYQFPADSPRAGLLSHASFAALHAHPGRSSATLRGKFVRETFLCQAVPPPPANVDFTMDEKDAVLKTARERLARHNEDAVCAGCHALMDPVGLGFEQFDGIGAFRVSEGSTPIDPSGVLDGVEFEDAAGLGRALHDHPGVVNCLVRNVYQYATGRPVAEDEQRYLEYVAESFAGDGYRWTSLLRTIATGPAFYAVAGHEDAAREATTVAASQGESAESET